MILQPEVPGGLPLIRRVFNALFGPAAPPASSPQPLADRIEVTAVVLADDLASDPDLGFPQGDPLALVPTARYLARTRWRYETGRLHDGECRQTAVPS